MMYDVGCKMSDFWRIAISCSLGSGKMLSRILHRTSDI